MLRVRVSNCNVNMPEIRRLLHKEDVFLVGTKPIRRHHPNLFGALVSSVIEVDSGTEKDFRELVMQLSDPTRGIFVEKIPDEAELAARMGASMVGIP